MCQALGIVPVDKYEASGGPSIAAIVGLLRAASIGAELPKVIAERAVRIVNCAEALVATARAEGWHRPVIDRVLALMKRRSGQLEP